MGLCLKKNAKKTRSFIVCSLESRFVRRRQKKTKTGNFGCSVILLSVLYYLPILIFAGVRRQIPPSSLSLSFPSLSLSLSLSLSFSIYVYGDWVVVLSALEGSEPFMCSSIMVCPMRLFTEHFLVRKQTQQIAQMMSAGRRA